MAPRHRRRPDGSFRVCGSNDRAGIPVRRTHGRVDRSPIGVRPSHHRVAVPAADRADTSTGSSTDHKGDRCSVGRCSMVDHPAAAPKDTVPKAMVLKAMVLRADREAKVVRAVDRVVVRVVVRADSTRNVLSQSPRREVAIA